MTHQASSAPETPPPASYPVDDDDDDGFVLPGDGGSTRVLNRLLRASPFLDLHDRAGGDHPFRENICFAVDALIRLVVWLVLIGIVVAVAWKALAPLPSIS